MDNSGMVYPQSHELYGGLTKRELFAAMAMQGMIGDKTLQCDLAAVWSVQAADALLAELAKEQPK